MKVASQGAVRVRVGADHREGLCENCGTKLEQEFHMEKPRIRLACGKCGGQGRLIARSVPIEAPPPPQCVTPRCLFGFFKDVLYCSLLSTYHKKRVEYAEKNRHKRINDKYRTGMNAPANIPQAIIEIIKIGGKRWLRVN